MEQKLAVSVDTAFGLAFNIEKTPGRNSGFKPAQFDLGAGKELFGDLRLDGFAALLRIGFAKRLVIVGGPEGRYKHETPTINQAWVIREMLIHDYGIHSDDVRFISSRPNTRGNIAAISARMGADALGSKDCAVVSNHYHLPRACLDLKAAGLSIHTYPAEAFWLLEDENRKNGLIRRLGGGPLAERMTEELQGIAHKLRGTYQPRTDAPAVNTTSEHQK
ncbi:MAG: YdcF family protein [Patescibacteria group bacterium]